MVLEAGGQKMVATQSDQGRVSSNYQCLKAELVTRRWFTDHTML